MTPPIKIGFVLLTHKNPTQIARLINTLTSLFEGSPISIHHDQSKSNLDIKNLDRKFAMIVEDHVITNWGRFSVIDGAIKALKLMQQTTGLPDWVFLLSESCYPIKPSKVFYEHLAATNFDVHIHHELTDINNIARPWNKLCWNRYCNHEDSPFNILFPCYSGEHWFHANRASLEYLINYYNRSPLLRQYYSLLESRNVIVPEESYYQTIFANNFSLKLSNDHKRFIDWEEQGSHPKTLSFDDMSRLEKSDCLISRKFDISHDRQILDALDLMLGI